MSNMSQVWKGSLTLLLFIFFFSFPSLKGYHVAVTVCFHVFIPADVAPVVKFSSRSSVWGVGALVNIMSIALTSDFV